MMKVLILVLGFLLAIANVAMGQEATGLITTTKIKGKTVFVQNGKPIEKDQVLELMKSNPKALSAMKTSNVSKIMGHFFLGAAIFSTLGFFGRPVYNENYNYNETMEIKRKLGLGIVVSGVLMFASYGVYRTSRINAIQLYNSGINQNATRVLKVDMGMNSDGFGLRLRF